MAPILSTACVSRLSYLFLHSSHLGSLWFLLFSLYVIQRFLFNPIEINSHSCYCTCSLLIALSLPALPSQDCPKDNPHPNLPSVHVTASPSTSNFTMAHCYPSVWHGGPQIIFLLSPYSFSHLHQPSDGINLVYSSTSQGDSGRVCWHSVHRNGLPRSPQKVYLAMMGANNVGDLSPSSLVATLEK